MADVIKCATRDAYGNALKELGTRDDILVLDAYRSVCAMARLLVIR